MNTKNISVVVPTLNEAGNVAELIKRTHKALSDAGYEYELIFVDDHSKDKTRDIITKLASQYPVSVYLKQGPKGKAQSLLEGFAKAKYDTMAMLDADLQYAPEEIVPMAKKLEEGFDVVQSFRRHRDESWVRNFLSKGFSFIFIRLLHGFKLDTQSALKVFRSKIIKEINIDPTPWTFDLEFLMQSRDAGYKIVSYDINFSERVAGVSKINIIEAVTEIGLNALKLKFKKTEPTAMLPEGGVGMHGAGHYHKGKRFVTHSTLPHNLSALLTFARWQKFAIFLVLFILALLFVIYPLGTSVALIATLSYIYFFDSVFNLYLVGKSLRSPSEIYVAPRQLAQIDDFKLPTYTILCPLYKEAHILPGFLQAIEKLDWPKDKLDVQLLLEEDDTQTIFTAHGMNLPSYVRVVVVPHSLPKTKPKACNYGLSLAIGEYLVIYDAEDIPEPKQLKKAWYAFQNASADIMCLQAKLNYFNPHHNWLTRFFTAEYSLWFDVILPGLQSINTYIPLGGTSNHFRTKDLMTLQGWDPFNVTEDCDLGARLFKLGGKTAIIDSVTLEEANSNLKNWIRQRSRWIKGYMQTYLVHMRHPLKFFRDSGRHAFIFQLVVGGKIIFLLINPILWITTISYFAARATVGPTIEQLYPSGVFYIAVISLVVGNFAYLYFYMIGLAKKGHWSLIKYVYLVPVYWLMGSIAALMALYQLIVKPHFWEKTNHGLHLKKVPLSKQAQALANVFDEAPALDSGRGIASREWLRRVFSAGGMVVIATAIVNFINFFFSAFMGRVLTFEQLALVTFINTLWTMLGMFIHSYGATLTHKVSYYVGQGREDRAVNFYHRALRLFISMALIGSVIWVVSLPWSASFFNVDNITVLLMFTPVISFGILLSGSRAFLEGRLHFKTLSIIYVLEALIKLGVGVGIVYLGMRDQVYLAIPASIILTGIVAWFVTRVGTRVKPKKETNEPFPKAFYVSAIFASFSSTVFLSLDIVLVKHFMDLRTVGEYALLALVGKMVYFFAIQPNSLMVTLVSRDMGAKTNPIRSLYMLGSAALILIAGSYAGLVLFGNQLLPLLFGEKILVILSYVPLYVLGIGAFALTKTVVSYHLARERYLFPATVFISSVMMAVGIMIWHDNLQSIVNVVFYSGISGLGLAFLMHVAENAIRFAPRLLEDFVGAFKDMPLAQKGKRILIFNWRDTVHTFAGGAEIYIHEMAKKWVEEGNSVTLFCGNDGKSLRQETVDGVNVIRRGGFYFVYFWAFLYYFTRFRGKFDVVIDCENGVPFFTPLYVQEKTYCLLFHVHQEVFRSSLSKLGAAFASFLELDLMPLVYRKVKFITISASSRKEILESGLAQAGIEIVHPGVHITELAAEPKSPHPTILYLGRLKAYKSVDVLVKAFYVVASKIPDARLVIAGSGEEEGNLRRLVKKMDLEEKVEFSGKVTEKEKVSLMSQAWVFVNPSMMEGWGLTTVEANACGTPIIAADVPGLRDSVRDPHAGYLVKHGDYAGFAEKIQEIVEDRQLRESMGQEAVKWARNFDWKKTSRKFLSLITQESEVSIYE